MDLKFLSSSEIDKCKWDLLVEKYSGGLPYGYSWYLDSVCDSWHACVCGDYASAFPFQIKTKYGLPYSLQPFLTQQLGFLGDDYSVFENILRQVEKKVFYYQYQLFAFDAEHHQGAEFGVNYELDLNFDYEILRGKFSKNTKRNLKKAHSYESQIGIFDALQPSDIKFIFDNSIFEFSDEQKNKIKKLLHTAQIVNKLKAYKLEYNNELVAINVYIVNERRAVYLLSVQNYVAKKIKGGFLLVDKFIKANSNTSLILDFEGSNIPSIARFYASFGAKRICYPVIKKKSVRNFFGKIGSPNRNRTCI